MVKRLAALRTGKHFVDLFGVLFLDMFFHIILPGKGLRTVGTAHPMLVGTTSFNVTIEITSMFKRSTALRTRLTAHGVTCMVADNEMIEFSDSQSYIADGAGKKGDFPKWSDLIG